MADSLGNDEGSLDYSSDSEAKTDQSDASKTEDLSKNFSRQLNISKHEDQETASGNETPRQNRGGSVASLGKAKRTLNFDGAEKKNDGEWLQNHPWKPETKPDPNKSMDTTVFMSNVYTVSAKWRKSNKEVNLEKIYLNLPDFIKEMKGSSIRQELEDVLQIDASSLELDTNSTLLKVIKSPNMKLSPHVLEIDQKQNNLKPNDKESTRTEGGINDFMAFSLPPQQDSHKPSENNSWFLDCEYMLKMHLPDDSLMWFNNEDQQGKRIREIKPEKMDKRWVFIPSFRRASIALLDWPQDHIVTKDSTIRILVVRPSEFKEYVACCGHKFPIICLPQDEIGAGYPRYWIQKIALRLKLQFIWMIDDSVECFYEYHPGQEPPEHQVGNKPRANYTKYRRRKFGLVFERIEGFVKEAADNEKPIAAMSPKRWRGGGGGEKEKLMEPFVCIPPRIAVFLNVTALKSKEVYYRPELQTLEDMIFGYECEKNGLKVFIDNRIHQQDNKWQDTGARSPSVKQKPT